MKKIILPLIFTIAFAAISIVLGVATYEGWFHFEFVILFFWAVAGFVVSLSATIISHFVTSKKLAATLDLAIASVLSLGCGLAAFLTGEDSDLIIIGAIASGALFVVLIIATIIVNCVPERTDTMERKIVANNSSASELYFCPYCGGKITIPDAVFCVICGKKIK